MSLHTEDLVAIRDVIGRYSVAATLRDSAAISKLFVEDGVWRVQPPVNMEYRGRASIGPSIVSSLGGFNFLVQMSHSSAIDVDGNTARARTVIEEVGEIAGTNGHFRMLGIYHDDLVRTADGWRFRLREFQSIKIDTATAIETLAATNA